MKLQVTFKTPDAVENAIDEYLKYLNPDEVNKDEIYNKLNRWFHYGEYVTIEVDLEENTATVLEN